MNVNGVNDYASAYAPGSAAAQGAQGKGASQVQSAAGKDTSQVQSASGKDTSQVQSAQEKSAASGTDGGAVWSKSDPAEETKAGYEVHKMSKEDRAALVRQLENAEEQRR